MHMETITEHKVTDRPPNTQNTVYAIINECSLMIPYIFLGRKLSQNAKLQKASCYTVHEYSVNYTVVHACTCTYNAYLLNEIIEIGEKGWIPQHLFLQH